MGEVFVVSDVFECFLNRREVPPQELSFAVVQLEKLSAGALRGSPRERSRVRALIIRQLVAMRDDGLTHRGRIDAVRLSELLLLLIFDNNGEESFCDEGELV